MPQADKQAGTVLGTVLGIGVIGTIVVVTIINKCGQISKHIDATTPLDTTPAYNLIHTDGPRIPCNQPMYFDPSAPFPSTQQNLIPQTQPDFNSESPSAPQAQVGGVYRDTYFQQPPVAPAQSPETFPQSQQYPPADPVYLTLPSAPPAYMPLERATMNTIDYKGPCPKAGERLEIMCPAQQQIQYIRFSDSPSEIYELTNKNIRPGNTSTFTANDGYNRTIKWINPRARR